MHAYAAKMHAHAAQMPPWKLKISDNKDVEGPSTGEKLDEEGDVIMAEFANRGVANAGLTTGIVGAAGWLLNGGLGNILGGGNQAVCHENMPINRYEMALQQENAALRTQVEMHKAEIYTDNKLDAYNERVDKRFRCIEEQLASQAVYNERNTATLGCIGQQLSGLQAVMGQITKTVVDGTAVCPEYMPRFNSWTAPAAPATGA